MSEQHKQNTPDEITPTTTAEEWAKKSQVASGSLMPQSLKEGGHLNRRQICVIVFVIFAIVVVGFKATATKPKREKKKLPEPQQVRKLQTDGLSTPDQQLHALDREDFKKPIVAEEIPPTVPMKITEPPKPARVEVAEKQEPKPFAVKMRAAEEKPEQVARRGKEEELAGPTKEEAKTLPKGLRIPMMLLEPVRTGIATSVTAQVTENVLDTKGNVIVPVGSMAVIPFLPNEVNGRALNNPGGNAMITLPDGSTAVMRGQIKAIDGFAGLPGKFTKLNGKSFLAKMGGAIAKVGGNIAGRTAGVGGPVVQDAIRTGTAGTLGNPNIDRYLEVMPGTPFTFTVGL